MCEAINLLEELKNHKNLNHKLEIHYLPPGDGYLIILRDLRWEFVADERQRFLGSTLEEGLRQAIDFLENESNQEIDYYKYIQSPFWKEKAADAKARAGNRCQLCNKNGGILHVHHRTYERLGNELPEDLTVLCPMCHAKHHDRLPKAPQ